MPTLRRPTKEELDELSRQGVDISTLPDELPWYSPEEMTQIRAKEVAGGGAASAVGSTLKAHAGSYAGGALATAGAARLLSAVPHPLVKLPALAISALLGSVAGQKAQEIVMPETQGQWENEAEAYRTRFPKTTVATDVLAGAIVGGGKPNLRAPLYTAKGINQMLKVGLANVERPYAEAMANTLTGNAINTGLNAGLQLATRGEIDPLELAGSAAAGAIFTDPSALGKRIMPEWKPISRMPKKPVAKPAIDYTLLDKNISSPMEVEQVIANRNKQKAIDDEAAASEAAWQAKAAEIEALNNRIIEEETAKRAAALKNFRENDIRDKKRFSDSLIKRLFLKEYVQKVPKGADAITKASIEATNAQLRELSADTMRQHLWEKYAAQYDPETYNAHMQQKAAAEAKKAALVEQWKAQNADQNAKLAEQAAQEKQAKEFAKLHKKLIDETQAAEAERVRVAEATRKRQIDEMWKAYEAEQQEALRQKVNAEALAKEIAGGAVARPETPVEQPFAFRRGLKQVTGKGDAADQAQADYDKSQGAKYQPLNEEGTPALEGESADAINERTARRIKPNVLAAIDELKGLMSKKGFNNQVSDSDILEQVLPYLDEPEAHRELSDMIGGLDASRYVDTYGWLASQLRSINKLDKISFLARNKGANMRNQPLDEGAASVRGKDTPEFLGEAAKQGIKVGRTEDELTAPGVGRVRGVSYDPNSLGERLVLLDKMSTSDTGYHELLHSVLRDMRRSGDERLAKLADRIAAVGEERQVQAGGETYRDVVEGKKSILGKVGRWLDEVVANAKVKMGSDDPETLRRHLVAIARNTVSPETSPRIQGAMRYKGTGNAPRFTDNQNQPLAEGDYERYNELQARFKQLVQEGNTDGDELMKVWAESEAIKNKIEGRTPTAEDKFQPLEEDESNRPYTRIGAYRDKNQRLHSAYYDENAAYDAVDKLRREHPESKAVVIPAGQRFEVHVIDKGDDTKYQPLDYDNTERRFNILRPEIKRVSDISKPLGEGFTKFYEKFRELKGTLTNDVVGKLRGYIDFFNPKELYTQDNADMQAVVQRRLDMQYEGKTDIKLTPRQQEIDKIVQDNLDKSRELTNTYPKLPREVEKIENYLPRVVSHEALNTLLNTTPDNPKRQQLIADFYDYYRSLHAQKSGETREEWLTRVHEEADKELRNFLGGHSKERIDLAQQFGPIDKARGVGLPRSWIETNLIDVMSRFNNRYARRLAYHEAIEQHPELYSLMKDPIMGIGSNAAVRNVYDDISGHLEFNEAKRQAAAGLVRAAMLGPLTGAKDFVSNLVLGFQHQTPGQAVKSAIDSWSNIKENLAESFDAGINRHNFGSLEWGEGDANNIINVLRRTRDVINQVQGRNLLEQMTRATAFGQGKFLAMDNLYAAKNNSLSGQGRKFLKDFAPGWEKYVDAGEFPKEELARVAARYVESVQGTYDYRGLPAIAQKGTLAPYLSLARWNIEKFNNFLKYVVEPAKEGNITPLLMSTLGMVIGGAAVTKLVEMATNKKEKTPKLAELSAASEQGADITKATAWKLASMASAAGYAGILGDITKSLLDKAHGNKAQVYDNPLIIGLSAIGSNAWDVVEAAQSGDLNLTADALSNFLEDTTQAYRLTLNQVSGEKRKQIAKTDKMRDYRVYRQIRGEQVPNSSIDQPNPYIGADIRDFKNSESIEEAAKLLPSLISRAFEKADGDIEKLRLELAKLKAHNYQTMPSPATMPLSFLRYVNYLRLSQGDQVAQERVADYMRRNAIDKAKTRMIP